MKSFFSVTLAPGRPGSPKRPGSPRAPFGPCGPEIPRSPRAPFGKKDNLLNTSIECKKNPTTS